MKQQSKSIFTPLRNLAGGSNTKTQHTEQNIVSESQATSNGEGNLDNSQQPKSTSTASEQWAACRPAESRAGTKYEEKERPFCPAPPPLPRLPKEAIQVASITPVTPPSGKKRSLREVEDSIPRSEPPSKKSRHIIKPRHTLDPASFPKGFATPGREDPTSPLFFSHTPRQRPPLQPSFSSSEAAATMLNKTRDERGSGVTTLKLARGSINGASPPRASSTPGSWMSLGRGDTPESAQTSDASALQVLGSIGIVDLLEQDDRPTFIIDLGNTANFSPGPLQLLYANASLRAYEPVR